MFFSPIPIFNPKGSLQYLTNYSDINITGNGTTFLDSQFDLGPPHENRRIFIGVAWRGDATTARTLSSLTIDPSGVVNDTALTIHGQVGFGEAVTGNYGVALASAVIATGTTGSIEANFSNSVDEAHVVLYRKVGLIDSTPFDTLTDENESTTGGLSGSIDTADGGILLGVCAQGSISGTPAWTAGLTQDDIFQSATNELEILIGSNSRTAAATGVTVSSSATVDSNAVGNGFVIISWR